MKNFKNKKGITLVALIIIIIVLLILAVVAISAVNGDGIISKAKLARKNYQDAQGEENAALAGYLTQIQENAGNGESVTDEGENKNTVPGATFKDGETLVTLTWEQLKLEDNGSKYGYDSTEINDTSIGNYAFYYCNSLIMIIIPNSVTSIGEGAFESCDYLESITIGKSVTSIGNDAFNHCGSLTNITIQGNIENIGARACCGCEKLTSIIYKGISYTNEESFLSKINGCYDYDIFLWTPMYVQEFNDTPEEEIEEEPEEEPEEEEPEEEPEEETEG